MSTIDRLPKLVARAVKRAGMTQPATLIVVTAGARSAGAVSGGTNPTEASFAARGSVIAWKRKRLGETDVQATDRVVKLYAALIAGSKVPRNGDKITIEGATTRIVDIEYDGAAYNCLTRT